MILKYLRDHPSVSRADLELWSTDLAGAFTLLDVNVDDIKKLGLMMGKDLVWISLVGSFGWSGTPFCFDVVTRILRVEMAKKGVLKSYANWYCDDGIGVGSKKVVSGDIRTVHDYVTTLLGPSANNLEKSARGRNLPFIGYDINLDTWTLTVKRSNLIKTLRGFFAVDVEKSCLTLTDMQRLASWASRYSKVCPYFTPFVKVLWQEVKKRHNWSLLAASQLTEPGKGAVLIIKSLLLGSVLEVGNLARGLDSFGVQRAHSVVCEFDASLSGIGIIWYRKDGLREVPVGVGSWDIRCRGFHRDAKFQNRAEFIAGLVAVMGLRVLGLENEIVMLRGDSMTALEWSHSWSFKGSSMIKEAGGLN
jgi:hypothetical protein